jgi:DNA repair protein RecN (Recombination protein N)
MLQRLTIQNYALIDALTLEPGTGLNLITGETGAGKSILLGAFGLILGERADPAMILDASHKCVVEAAFRLQPGSDTLALLQQEELLDEQDPLELLLRRELSPQGKSRAFVNDIPTTLPVLRSLTASLVDVHSQRDGQRLLDSTEQLLILDQYAGCTPLRQAFAAAWDAIRTKEKTLNELIIRQLAQNQEANFRQHQLDELLAAALQPEEDTQLEQALQLLANATQLTALLGGALQAIEEADEQAARTVVALQLRALEKHQHLLPGLSEAADKLREALQLLDDGTAHLRSLREQLEADPERLAAIEARLDTYNRLKLKYRVGNAEALIAIRDGLAQELAGTEALGDQIAALQLALQADYKALGTLADELEAARQKGAAALAAAVEQGLADVALPNARFQVILNRLADPTAVLQLADGTNVRATPTGTHNVNYQVQLNAGAPMAALSQVASGGEVSRILLAIKRALAGKLALPLLIFDEIDTGISGEAALRVGKVMHELATGHQLIVITHLPQIAGHRGTHYHIYKTTKDGHTHTRLKVLQPEERVQELARMLAGDHPTPATLAAAQELLQ